MMIHEEHCVVGAHELLRFFVSEVNSQLAACPPIGQGNRFCQQHLNIGSQVHRNQDREHLRAHIVYVK